MKNIIFSMFALVFSFALISCVDDDVFKGPAKITGVTYAPKAVTSNDEVTVAAQITDLQGVVSAKIKYSVNGVAQSDIDMTSDGKGTFTGVIPKQIDKASIAFTVSVVNQAGFTTVSKNMNYVVGAPPIVVPQVDYTQLVLNEIDPSDKSIELYNKGTVNIPLEGVYIVKNNDDSNNWWKGVTAKKSIPAGGYIVIAQKSPDPLLVGTSGISGKKSLKFELKDPEGNSLGIFLRGDENALDNTITDVGEKSYQRTPNGTGGWFLAGSTIGTANPDSGDPIP